MLRSSKVIMEYEVAFDLRHEIIEPRLLDTLVLISCEAID